MYFYGRNSFYNRRVYNDERTFIVPFLLGGLAGGAAVGLTRPRPIYNVAPTNAPMPMPGYPYANYNYSYYVPYNSFPY